MAQKFLTEITLQALNNATTDTDKFLVSDGGTIKFRTGAEVLSDIGGQVAGNYVPTSRTLTINGVTYDLSADRSWTVNETDTLATVVDRGNTTNGGRPISMDTSGGGISIKGSGGGWATGYYFTGTAGTYRGGFGALGGNDTLSYYWIGPAYNAYYAYVDVDQLYHASSVRAPIFYDSNNTAYFLDIATQSEINKVYYNSNMVSRNFGIGQVGIYDSTKYQGVFSMGEAYVLPADGTSPSNLYGMAWSHPNAGGVASNLNTHGLLVMENGTFLAAVSGSIRSRDDMRTPIFYDSDNTNYYLDPDNTSNLASSYIAGHYYGSSNSSNILIRTEAYSAEMGIVGQSSSGNFRFQLFGRGTEYGFLSSEWGNWDVRKVTGGNMYLNDQESYYYGTDTAYLVRVYGTTDMRSPIYYDLDNTGFYLNPTGISEVNTIYASSFIKNGGTSSQYLMADGSVTTGGGAVSWSSITGKPSSIFYYQGFGLDANTMDTNSSGFTYANNAPFNGPVARFSAASGYDLWLNAPYGGGNGLAFRTKNGDINTINPWKYPAIYGVNVNGGGDLYANIYYDQNDTSYYLNPDGTSVLNAVSFSGSCNWFGGYGPGSGAGLAFENLGTFARMAFWGLDFYDWNHGIQMTIDNGYVSANNSFRAPIFYDVDNTVYYTNPAGSSYMNSIIAFQYRFDSTTFNPSAAPRSTTDDMSIKMWNNYFNGTGLGSDYGTVLEYYSLSSHVDSQVYFDAGGGSWYRSASYNSGWQGWQRYITDANISSYAVPPSRTLTINGTAYDLSADRSWTVSAGAADFNTLTNKTGGTGTYQTSGDFRAPIFYDSNDTAYYINPADADISAVLKGTVTIGGGTGGNYDEGLRIIDSGSFSVIAFGATGNANPGRFNLLKTSGDTFQLRNGDSAVLWETNQSGNTTFNVDVRTPIFYDSNDTIYYLDPNNTTKALNVAGKLTVNVGSSSGTPVLEATGAYGTMSINTYYGVFHTSGDFYIGPPASSGNTLSGNQARFASFIDRNNSAYYLTPSSDSNLNTGNLAGRWRYSDYLVSNNAGGLMGDYNVSGTSAKCIWTIGESWPLGNMYGLAYEYDSTYAHSLSLKANGITYARLAFGGEGAYFIGTVSSGTAMSSPIYYDSNDSNYYFAGSDTGDSIRVAGDIVAYYSDERLKDRKGNIENALEKVLSLNGFYYEPNEKAQALGYKKKLEVGVSAQEVQAILPEIIKDAPIGGDYKTLDYGRLTPLLIEAIKEQQTQIDELKELVNKLINK